MKTLNNFTGLTAWPRPICMAIGVFDGVHRGHGKVLSQALSLAKGMDGEAWVFTFSEHPMKSLGPADAPPLLTSTAHKLRLLAELGIHGCLLMQFATEIAELSPESFIVMLCGTAPSIRAILVGEDWRFGKGARGDVALLRKLAADFNVEVIAVPPVMWNNEPISSTRIRDAASCGRLAEAETMLGRPFSILGTVVKGRHIGATLGYPTANLNRHNEVCPPLGVYAVRALIGSERLPGVLNIGTRPTFADTTRDLPVLELHLPGADMNLYGLDIEVLFVRRLRDERKFETTTDLRNQIARDITEALESMSGS